MLGGQGARRRRARTEAALERVFERIGGSHTVVGCITRREPHDRVDPKRVTGAIYEFATHRGADLTARSRLRNVTLRANPTHFISAFSRFLGLHVRPGFLILETVVVQ